jgi:hypothetical protein
VVRGNPEQRRTLREQKRQANRIAWVRERAAAVRGTGHQLVVVACNAALAVSRRITDDARRALARAIAEAVQRLDTPANRKDSR